MTPQQVEEATEGFARMTREELPREGREPRLSNRAEFESELSNFEVEYYHDHTGLQQIRLIPEFDDCDEVLNAFVSTFGEPIEYQEQVILRNFAWHDEENDNRIVLAHSTANLCTVYFYSLSDYTQRMEARAGSDAG